MCTHKLKRSPVGRFVAVVAALAMAGSVSLTAWAEGPGPIELSRAQLAADTAEQIPVGFALAQADTGQPAEETIEVTTLETFEEGPSCPVSLSLTYALYSDYIFRGINFSEYAGEGREKPNHQLTVSLAWDTGDFGTFGYDAWFEWFAGQKKIDPDRGGQNLQEVDHSVWWSYSLDDIATDVTLGVTFYQFVNLAHSNRSDGARGNNNDDRSVDVWLSLEHNDAWMWKSLFPDNEDGVLNPSFLLAQDVGSIVGTWMEFGMSHCFPVPGVDNLTITPGYTLMVNCNYWKHGFFIAGDQWSLAAEYDLTPVLQLPDWAGSLALGGELYFFNAYGNFEGPDTHGEIRGQDEFWGGMTVTWSWGG